MVDQDVLRPDGRETVAAVVADALGIARLEGLEFQLRAVGRDELRQLGHAQKAVYQDHVLRLGVQAMQDEIPQFRRHGRLDFYPHHQAQPTLLEHLLELAHQVFGLFLDFHIAVPQQAEHALHLHFAAGEQMVEEQRQQSLQRQESPPGLGRTSPGLLRQLPETRHLGGHRREGVERLAVAQALELQRHAEGQVGNEREGVRRIDRQRREDGEKLAEEDLL